MSDDNAFGWKPEPANGRPSLEEIETIRRSLTHAERGNVGIALHPPMAINTYVGEHETLVSAEMTDFDPKNIDVFLNGEDLHIVAARPGENPVDQSLKLPFVPDPRSAKVLFIQGVLYIHLVRP